MPVVSLKEILDRALAERYGVAAINIVNDLTLEAVLAAAVERRAPLIVQTSVKTVRAIGLDVLYGMWTTMTAGIEVPVCLHLDHCPERDVISDCLRTGWNSVLFDASRQPVEENLRQVIEVVAQARAVGAHVEGEIEAITGVEDGIGSDDVAKRQSLDVAVDFIQRSGVDVFAPSIGNAHGVYVAEPTLDAQRVTDLVEATGIPIALHGGTGMTDEQFTDLIARGCAKVNISTALKVTFMKANLEFLRGAEAADKWDPPSLFAATGTAVKDMAAGFIDTFGSAGKAWVSRPVGALIFDCDGVLADTERFGHLRAFNQMFAEFGLPVQWSEEEYGEKLKIGGGKERMMSLFTPEFIAAAKLPGDAEGQRALVGQWHQRKTEIYTELVSAGKLPGRPGVARLVGEATEAGWHLAVASTSAEPSVRAVLDHVVGPDAAAGFLVLAGDVVRQKKPAPDIYLMALDRLGLDAAAAVVVEDSGNGFRAARAAGIATLITVNDYTRDDDFTGAALVVSSLGEPDGEQTRVLANDDGVPVGD